MQPTDKCRAEQVAIRPIRLPLRQGLDRRQWFDLRRFLMRTNRESWRGFPPGTLMFQETDLESITFHHRGEGWGYFEPADFGELDAVLEPDKWGPA